MQTKIQSIKDKNTEISYKTNTLKQPQQISGFQKISLEIQQINFTVVVYLLTWAG